MGKMILKCIAELPGGAKVVIVAAAVLVSVVIGIAMSVYWPLAFSIGGIIGILLTRLIDHYS